MAAGTYDVGEAETVSDFDWGDVDFPVNIVISLASMQTFTGIVLTRTRWAYENFF